MRMRIVRKVSAMFVTCVMLSVLFVTVNRMAEARIIACWANQTLNAIDMTCKRCGPDHDYTAEMRFDGRGYLIFNPADIAGCTIWQKVIVNARLGIYRLETRVMCPIKNMEIRIFLHFLCCGGICERLGSGTIEVWKGINNPIDPITGICNLKWFYNPGNDPVVDFSEVVGKILNH